MAYEFPRGYIGTKCAVREYRKVVEDAERKIGEALLTEFSPSKERNLKEDLKEMLTSEPTIKEAGFTVARLIELYEAAKEDKGKSSYSGMPFSTMRRLND
jgi:hypothetical protein